MYAASGVVVAGILPAVEPGILPGGKTARGKTRLSSLLFQSNFRNWKWFSGIN
jgi:hypothetical protein